MTLKISAKTRRWSGIVALHPESGDDVELPNEGGKQRQIGDVELAVGVHEHHEVAGRGVETGGQGGSVAPIDLVGDRLYPRVSASQVVEDLG